MNSVLITGATSGIGKQLAKDYADAGATVIACGRNRQVLQELE
ncbi:SDR family NAD(P)-dependent oxidoreductase, partial [Vibrio vulnificus]